MNNNNNKKTPYLCYMRTWLEESEVVWFKSMAWSGLVGGGEIENSVLNKRVMEK